MVHKEEHAQLILLIRLASLPWEIVVHVVRFINLPTANPWSPIQDMPSARSTACAAILDRKVFVIGGYNSHEQTDYDLKSCEVYDPVQKQWCRC